MNACSSMLNVHFIYKVICLLTSILISQYLYPEKRNILGATNAISNLSLKITSALENRLRDWFEEHGILPKEEVCHRIRNQWMIYQNEDIPERYYVKEQAVKKKQQLSSPVGIVR